MGQQLLAGVVPQGTFEKRSKEYVLMVLFLWYVLMVHQGPANSASACQVESSSYSAFFALDLTVLLDDLRVDLLLLTAAVEFLCGGGGGGFRGVPFRGLSPGAGREAPDGVFGLAPRGHHSRG